MILGFLNHRRVKKGEEAGQKIYVVCLGEKNLECDDSDPDFFLG